jgi:hypothetical protein
MGGSVLALLSITMGAEAPAAAKPNVSILLSSENAVAPAKITATATISGSGTILSYDWGALETWPRCRGPHCQIDVAVASCQQLQVEVTTALAETVTATRTLCVNDEHGEAPPIALLNVVTTGSQFTVGRSWIDGTSRVETFKFWLDDTDISSEKFANIPVDGGCHAIDLFVADSKGRVGFDHREVCTKEDAPTAWLGAMPSACPPIGSRIQLCSEASSPLAMTVVESSGAIPLGACTMPAEAPTALTRSTIRVADARGVMSTASLFTCGAPTSGPHRLLIASLPDLPELPTGADLKTTLQVFGAVEPLQVVATLSDGNDQLTNIDATMGSTTSVWNLSAVHLTVMGKYRLDAVVTDSRRLTAHASAAFDVGPHSAADGGSGHDSGGRPQVASGGRGCAGSVVVPVEHGALRPILALLSLVIAASAVRRKR